MKVDALTAAGAALGREDTPMRAKVDGLNCQNEIRQLEAAADVGASLLMVLNGLRLLRRDQQANA